MHETKTVNLQKDDWPPALVACFVAKLVGLKIKSK